MRILEARFRSQQPDGRPFFVVGYVTWKHPGDRAIVRPSAELMERDEPATALSKLQYLVESTKAAQADRLLELRSHFWSFVEVPG